MGTCNHDGIDVIYSAPVYVRVLTATIDSVTVADESTTFRGCVCTECGENVTNTEAGRAALKLTQDGEPWPSWVIGF